MSFSFFSIFFLFQFEGLRAKASVDQLWELHSTEVGSCSSPVPVVDFLIQRGTVATPELVSVLSAFFWVVIISGKID